MKPIHQRFNLYSDSNDAYIFVPIGESVAAQSLTIHRNTGDIVLNPPQTTHPYNARRSGKSVYGIMGIISLTLSEYVVIITGRESLGSIMGNDVYRASDFDILPLNPNVNVYNPPHPVEAHLLALLRSHLNGGVFIFSYGWDMTRRLQAQHESQEKDVSRALWEAADDRFFWNRFLQTRLIEASGKQDLSGYILPVIYGTFDIRPVFMHGTRMEFCLISRRSRFRSGTRYFRRGIDHEGHVANFNESEQILLVENQNLLGSQRSLNDYAHKFSFVQIRGSVPLFWAEINTLRYKPDLQIMDLSNTPDVVKMHLLEQNAIYGLQTLVNLVNHKGHERPVKEAYERHVEQLNLPQVRYQYFDFHTECKNMRWDRISVLVDKVQDDLQKYGYLHVSADQPTPVKMQMGVVRTNCMDNLDRTSVVQAALAKYTLNKQLQEVGILSKERGVDDVEALSKDFREMWADHADSISKAYAGSGALKSDFTRTNKRTQKGVLEDGVKSVLRYLKNNHFDGARQDAFDLVTGAWLPRKTPSSALFLITDTRSLVVRSMPAIAFFSGFMICAGLTLPRTSDYSLFYYFLLWFILLALSLTFIIAHGILYVSWPRLIPLNDAVYYNGPGYRSARHGMGVGGKLGTMVGKRTNWIPRVQSKVEEGAIPLTDSTKKRVD
ncbi:phosphoinositide phosphatase [Moniliophthora roreri MCA 2997]|uniref:Phosphoinositide phosphatase n=1 Tax=Moniliophthora roreri (strain MCA 2997) TaxID=1381753 RepID=V2Z2N6_MONRO|nr:phosphoinositide phosphatase [Moniliophthora roreri MCA 2997]